MNTSTNPTRIGASNTRKRVAAVLAAGLAIGGVGVGAVAGLASADSLASNTPAIASIDLAELTRWADANGYTGLSPASLRPVPTTAPEVPAFASADLAAIAEWADANGYTGLSPASLRPIED